MSPEGAGHDGEQELPDEYRPAKPGRLADDEETEGRFRRQPAEHDDVVEDA